MDCRDIREDIDLYALGTLSPVEAERVRTHAATCDACRAELLAAEAVAAQLALAAPRVAAPAGLRRAVFDAIHTEQAPVPPKRRPVALRRALTLRRRLTARYGAIAAAVALFPLVGLLTWAVLLQRQVNELREDTAQMQRRNDGLLLLAMPSSVKADFQPAGDGIGAVGAATWHPERGLCFVFFDQLPRPEPGTTYRLWYVVDGRIVINAGAVLPDEHGRAEAIIDASRWRGRDYELILRLERAPRDPEAEPVLTALLRRP